MEVTGFSPLYQIKERSLLGQRFEQQFGVVRLVGRFLKEHVKLLTGDSLAAHDAVLLAFFVQEASGPVKADAIVRVVLVESDDGGRVGQHHVGNFCIADIAVQPLYILELLLEG